MSLSKASEMIVKGTFDIGKNLAVAQWKYISGQDVQLFSRVRIGDFVDWKYIMISRLALISILYHYKKGIEFSVDNIRTYIEEWLDSKKSLNRLNRRENIVGAAVLQNLYTFIQQSWDVVFILIDSMISITSAYVKLMSTGVNTLTGFGTSYDIGPLIFSTIENIVSNTYMPTAGPCGVGVLSFASLTVLANFIENKVVGILAQSLEYLVNGGVRQISDENIRLVLKAGTNNPTLNREEKYIERYPFTTDKDMILEEFEKFYNLTKIEKAKVFMIGSDLRRAVQDAKYYFENIESLHGRQSGGSKCQLPTIIPNSTTLRRRKKKDDKICVGQFRNGKACTNKAKPNSDYCGRHRRQDPNNAEFGKKNNLLQKTTLIF